MTLYSLRTRIRPWLAAVTMLVAVNAAPAHATQPDQYPPETLVPNQEYTDAFDQIASMVESGGSIPQPPSAVTATLDSHIAQMFARGERVADWSRSGVDMFAVVAAREGGLEANALSGTDQFGPFVVFLGDVPFDRLVAPAWRVVWNHGAIEPGRASFTTLTRLSPKVSVVERILSRRREQAWCRERAESRIYMDPQVAASEADMIALVMAMRTLAMLDQRPAVCSVTTEIEPGVYRDRVFDPEGHRLPAFDAAQLAMRIVPREELIPHRN